MGYTQTRLPGTRGMDGSREEKRLDFWQTADRRDCLLFANGGDQADGV